MKRHNWSGLPVVAAILVGLGSGSALADETVNIGGSRAVLIKPNTPRGSVILMPGGDGSIAADNNGEIRALKFNLLVRTRQDFAARGLAVLVVDAGTPLDGAVKFMAGIKRPVTVIATSRGTLRAAAGIARGARPDALVLISGMLSDEFGQRPERHVDSRLAVLLAADAGDPSPQGCLPDDFACRCRTLRRMVGGPRSGDHAESRDQ